MKQPNVLEFTEKGIYCPQADVYIDPWRPVDKAIITHAHSDHARWGMNHYLAHPDSVPIMRLRLGADISLQTIDYNETISINGVQISLHPAGHIIGSAQVRVAYRGEVWVVSGDYKIQEDGLATAFEPVECHAFITESTFGLPVYRWEPQAKVMREVNEWWASNAAENVASLLIGYSLGKAQRLLEHLDRNIGPVYTHGAVENTNEAFRAHGIELKPTQRVISQGEGKQTKKDFRKAIIIAPPGAIGSVWTRKFQPFSLGIASGWMRLRGTRRRRAADRGFILSDHADWDGLLGAITATGAERIFVTHGYANIFAQYINQHTNLQAWPIETRFEGETTEGEEADQEVDANATRVDPPTNKEKNPNKNVEVEIRPNEASPSN